MHPLICKLKAEHRQFIQILSVMKDQLDQLEDTTTNCSIDFTLMQNVVDYIAAYPNHWHHPFENIMFRKLLHKTSANQHIIVKLGQEHGKIERLTEALRVLLDSISRGNIVPIKQVLDVGREFLDLQYAHLFLEEDVAFPMCETCFTEADWREIEAQEAAVDDPLFGHKTEDQFQHLYENAIIFAQETTWATSVASAKPGPG